EAEGFRAVQAGTLAEGRARLAEAKAGFRAVFVDDRLPDGPGAEAALALAATPRLIVLAADPVAAGAARLPEGTCVLAKPFLRTDLLRALHQSVSG
ncbi:MAG: hypothetical protein O2894_05995, partial [Planctomycetota bacterium]|nr:hypothetical protein [Planctomycetota bacterium]